MSRWWFLPLQQQAVTRSGEQHAFCLVLCFRILLMQRMFYLVLVRSLELHVSCMNLCEQLSNSGAEGMG